jgi:hypothetical protein
MTLHWLALPLTGTPSPTVVASGVVAWQISPDGKAWSWFDQLVGGGDTATARLVAAAFPGGTPRAVQTGVRDPLSFGARGFGFLKDVGSGGGTLFAVPDILAPVPSSVASGVQQLLAASPAGDWAYATRTGSDPNAGSLVNVEISHAGGGGCVVAAEASAAPVVSFLPAGRGLLWFSPKGQSGSSFRVFLADLASCASTSLSLAAGLVAQVGEAGVALWEPTLAPGDAREGTLLFTSASLRTMVQTRADSSFVSLDPWAPRLGFTVHADTTDKRPARGHDGFYLSAPFASEP